MKEESLLSASPMMLPVARITATPLPFSRSLQLLAGLIADCCSAVNGEKSSDSVFEIESSV